MSSALASVGRSRHFVGANSTPTQPSLRSSSATSAFSPVSQAMLDTMSPRGVASVTRAFARDVLTEPLQHSSARLDVLAHPAEQLGVLRAKVVVRGRGGYFIPEVHVERG